MVDCEMLQAMSSLLQPVTFTDDDLGLSAQENVLPGGHFFGSEHTMSRYRDAFTRLFYLIGLIMRHGKLLVAKEQKIERHLCGSKCLKVFNHQISLKIELRLWKIMFPAEKRRLAQTNFRLPEL